MRTVLICKRVFCEHQCGWLLFWFARLCRFCARTRESHRFGSEDYVETICNNTNRMLIPKKNRVTIYEYLFKEGVLVAKKDFFAPKHPEIDVPNLHVIKALTSLKSRGFVREQFAWRNYYWYLTNEGIQYLRDFLHLPAEIVPATLKRQTRPEAQRPRPKGPSDGGPRGPAPDREYRTAGGPPGGDKKADVGAGADPSFQFRGGFGRGRPREGFGQPPSQE